MAAVPAVAMIGSTVMQAFGASDEARAKEQAATHNAQMGHVRALQAEQQGVEQERMLRVQGNRDIGDSRANYGASGVSSASGSPLAILQNSARNLEMDALNIKYAANRNAWGYRMGAQQDMMNAGASRTAGQYGVASAIFRGGGRLYSHYGKTSLLDQE